MNGQTNPVILPLLDSQLGEGACVCVRCFDGTVLGWISGEAQGTPPLCLAPDFDTYVPPADCVIEVPSLIVGGVSGPFGSWFVFFLPDLAT